MRKIKYLSYLPFPNTTNIFFKRFCFVYKKKINKNFTLIFLTKCAFTLTIFQQHLRQH